MYIYLNTIICVNYAYMQQTDLSSLNLSNVKAEFLPLLSNMIIQNWQLRLLDVIGEGYSHLCMQLHMVNIFVNR